MRRRGRGECGKANAAREASLRVGGMGWAGIELLVAAHRWQTSRRPQLSRPLHQLTRLSPFIPPRLVQEYGLVKLQQGIVTDECSAGRDAVRREREELERMKDVLVERRVRAEREAIEERARADELELRLGEIEAAETGLEGRLLVQERKEREVAEMEEGARRVREEVERREKEVRAVVEDVGERETKVREKMAEVKRREKEVGEIEMGKIDKKVRGWGAYGWGDERSDRMSETKRATHTRRGLNPNSAN